MRFQEMGQPTSNSEEPADVGNEAAPSGRPGVFASISGRARPLAAPLLDIIFPRLCVHCQADLRLSDDPHFCGACRKSVKLLESPTCPRCARPLPTPADQTGCATCKDEDFRFDYALAACQYDGAAASAVQDLKYRGNVGLDRTLADMLLQRVRRVAGRWTDKPLLVPVPLHWRRRALRGYNQSELIGRRVAKAMGWPMITRCLRRVRNTDQQTGLSMRQRVENVHGAFEVVNPDKLSGFDVFLLDDVMTTGATLSECARTLKKAGVERVFALAVARRLE